MTTLERTLEAVNDGGIILRTARKSHQCDGDGRLEPNHAAGCPLTIEPGARYMECLWTAAGFQSGSHHSAECAVAYFEGWVMAR